MITKLSHQSFSTFFSGTDTSELKDNVDNHNYYLSLIVNNAMETSCKIAFKGKQSIQQHSIISFNGYDGKLSTIKNNTKLEEDVMFTYNCNVELEQSFNVSSTFSKRVDEIISNKVAADEAKKLEQASKKSTLPINKYYNQASFQRSFEFDEEEPWIKDTLAQEEKYESKSYNNKKDILEDDELEGMVADCLCGKYQCLKTVDEALFSANIDYKEKGEKYIAEVGIFFRNMYPAYTGEDEPDESMLTDVLETLYFYGEDEFPELTELLAIELVNELAIT